MYVRFGYSPRESRRRRARRSSLARRSSWISLRVRLSGTLVGLRETRYGRLSFPSFSFYIVCISRTRRLSISSLIGYRPRGNANAVSAAAHIRPAVRKVRQIASLCPIVRIRIFYGKSRERERERNIRTMLEFLLENGQINWGDGEKGIYLYTI